MKLSIRVAAFLSFLLAGALSILADRERWWPACALGRRDSAACLEIQSHVYDFLVPMEPWTPTGNSATLIGISFLVSAVALTLTIPLAARPSRVFLPLGLLAGSVAVVGYLTLNAGLSLTAVPLSLGRDVLALYELGGPLLILWAWAADTVYRGRESLAHHLLYFSVFLSTGLTLYFSSALMLGYQSHDTSPWNQAFGGALFIVAGLICLRGFNRSVEAGPGEAAEPEVRPRSTAA